MNTDSPTGTTRPRDRRTLVITAVCVVIAALVIASAASWFLLRDDEETGGQAEEIILAAFAHPEGEPTTESEIISHLTVTGGSPGNTDLAIHLTGDEGEDLGPAGYAVTVDLTNMNDGTDMPGLQPEPDMDASTPTFPLDDPGFETEGWWRVHLTVQPPEGDALVASWYLMLPDPNLAGFDSPPAPETDPEAEQMLSTALTQMSEWTSLQWWQWLSGGNDSIIVGDFAVTTTDANGQPDAFRNEMTYSAGFQVPEGAEPAPPRRDHYVAVTIGEDAWIRDQTGEVREASPTRYLPITHYPETYEGATNIVAGIREEVDGRMAQVVTFHVPTLPTQTEAWYLFWIDEETGDVLRLAMISTNHYMLWIYSDVNGDFIIEPPEATTWRPAPVAGR